ncbi:ribosomal biogenesis protein LAS1L [Anolis carolinensis]|uniref:LAS1 like ribosome biosis factor n=1 Tax=Anolis carolinensis TaxID=28377 RepID=H9GK04_ANOCA|nr:PREDICTED: ribosomal biogenesis protein LAS1L [Anolis carolinensis]|eukprot:XP_008117418.1 PREDICTED: ribosomal biogenesis protein LAS1L [Anolis carolinensis]
MAGSSPQVPSGRRQRVAKSQRKRPRSVVAWQSKAEWDQVMVGLYCGDCQMQQEALDRVSVWKSRYGHRMPLAVESTADLVRCKLLDASGNLKSHELVLTYGLALVRFLNLITERKQKKFTTSLRWLAKELNIPVWIVDLRHELTHGKLPPLVTCQKGCDVVLDWLRRTYWSRQLGNSMAGGCEEEEEDGEGSSATESGTDSSREEPEKFQSPGSLKHLELHEKVMDVLMSYKKQQYKILQELEEIEEACKVWCSSSSEVEWVVAQMNDLLQENREVVAGALLDDGFLIPTLEDLQILYISSQATKEWDFKIPRRFFCFWHLLLKGLHYKDFTQTLLEKMFVELKRHGRDPDIRSRYLIHWITKILKTNMQAKKKRKKHSLALFRRPVPLQWLKLLEGCLEAPCWASPHLLHLILSSMEPPLPPDSQEKLLYLTSIYTQEEASRPSPGSTADLQKQPIYTIESLQFKLKHSGNSRRPGRQVMGLQSVEEEEEMEEEEEEEKVDEGGEDEEEEEMDTQLASPQEPYFTENAAVLAEKRMALQGSAWQLNTDGVKWKNFPLGRLPGQSDDPDTLLVDNYTLISGLDQLVKQDKNSSPDVTSSEWGGASAAEGLLWTQSQLHKLKSGLQLY